MDYRFKRNQVAKQDQLETLRENLKGQALRLVPETTEDIDAAWKVLKEAFGDAARVLQHRLDILQSMGDLPPEGTDRGAPSFAKRIEFLIKLENTVRDIIELGKGDDDDLMYLAFNSRTVGTIVNKFPNYQILKLNKLGGRGEQRLEKIMNKIAEFRTEAQELEKTKSLFNPASATKSRRDGRGSGGGSSQGSGGGSTSGSAGNTVSAEPDCRVCYHLK